MCAVQVYTAALRPSIELERALRQRERSGAWLARKTGKSPSYVSKVLRGTRRPSRDFQIAAAIALGVPPGELFPPSA